MIARLAILGAALVFAGVAEAAVPVPGPPQQRPIALIGATIHTVSAGDIEGGTILFDQGRIAAIGRSIPIPETTQRIDVTGKHVYPGLVDPYSIIGLSETEAVRSTVDHSEVGEMTPNVKAQVAVNPESEAIPVARSNGVLTALVAPRGTLLRGNSALMMMDGWTWEEMTLESPVAVHVNWPSLVLRAVAVPADSMERMRERRARQVRRLDEAFDEARAYAAARKGARGAAPAATDMRWEALLPVIERKIPLIVEADEIQQIESAVAFAARQNVRLVIYGGYDAARCAALLRKHDVAVIVRATYRLPVRNDESYDDPFTLPERLRQAGVRFCIANGGGYWNERNLPYQAAQAVAFGLPRDEALKSITLYPAQILGAADRIGALELGKDATLIVTDGDPLEIPTHVERAFIQGRPVDLQDKQKVLWEKYREKYRRLEAARAGR